MVKLLAMLAQQIHAVVIAIWGAHNCMNVLARWRIIIQGNTPLMVKLDEDDRAVDTVVEHAMLINAAHPGKVRFFQVPLDFLHLHPSVTRPQAPNVGIEHTPEQLLLATA
jgi:hypothetical protein